MQTLNQIEVNEIVTLDIGAPTASNTFYVDKIEDAEYALLRHPLNEKFLLRAKISELNRVAPKIKDSAERCIDFVKQHGYMLSQADRADIDSLSIYFIYYRKLTDRQKKALSDLCGKIAVSKLSNRIEDAMNLIRHHEHILDDFNMLWYHNFEAIFKGQKEIVSKKQIDSIFNMAGFVLAELNTPKTYQK